MSFPRWLRPELPRMFLAAPLTALLSTSASAETSGVIASAAPASSRTYRHSLYVDAFGRGGLWGLGYDYQLSERFTVGSTGSFYVLDSQRVFNVSPYLGFYPAISGHHRWLVQAGPQFLRTSTISPVPEWNGVSSTGLSAVIATGYEYRNRFLFRIYAMTSMGNRGITPWVGFSFGRTL